MSGFIKIHRKLQEWGWANDPNMVALWTHILLSANYKPTKWRNETLAPGQLIFGLNAWCDKTGITYQKLRTCISRLIESGEINVKSTNKYSVITVVNWEFYQLNDSEPTNKQQTTNNQATIKQQSTNKQLTTPKEGKKERIIKRNNTNVLFPKSSDDELFDAFWEDYPRQRRGNKTQALSAYRYAIREKRATAEEINQAAKKYAESDEVRRGYAKGAAAWIRADRFLDDYASPQRNEYGAYGYTEEYWASLKEADEQYNQNKN